MDPEGLFKFANLFALAGWVALVAGIVTNRPWLRDRLARMYWPLAISVGYTLAIAAGWSTGKGGFFSLADVRQLFANDWFLLAGWMHYLVYCGPVLRHSAGPIQAANFRLAIAF